MSTFAPLDFGENEVGADSLIEDAISQATFVLIPCRASALDLTALDTVIDIRHEHDKPYAFVLNAVHPRRKLTKTAPVIIRRYGPLCETMIADRKAYVAAMTVGKGASEVERDNAAAAELDALWAELEALMRPEGREAMLKGRTWRLGFHAPGPFYWRSSPRGRPLLRNREIRKFS